MEVMQILQCVSFWRLNSAHEIDLDALTLEALAQWRINLYSGCFSEEIVQEMKLCLFFSQVGLCRNAESLIVHK